MPQMFISRREVSYLEEHGWKFDGTSWKGHFATARGAFAGEAAFEIDRLIFYVYAPPISALTGEHSGCFRPIGNGWFWVHISGGAAAAADGVIAIQKVMGE
jgi:hypothetical protein